MISAQVVLNADDLLQAPRVKERLAAAGFQVGPLVGNSFSIAGPVKLFEGVFKMPAGGQSQQPFPVKELPLTGLEPDVREPIQTVLFTQAPDFGPGGNY
jgi:hypothetical protein